MSFSSDIKKELSLIVGRARHCMISEIAAIFTMCGNINISERNRYRVLIHTENVTVATKFYVLVKELFEFKPEVSIRHNSQRKNSRIYYVVIRDTNIAVNLLKTIKLLNSNGDIEENLSLVNNIIIQNNCCKRAFIRGAFLIAGSMSNPEKTYHFEITAPSLAKAIQLQNIIISFHIDAKIVQRKKYYVVYIKDGEMISDILKVMEAHNSLMELENVRILKDIRNSINRQVNCETANINKTVNAATRHIEDILFIKEKMGFEQLSDGLKEIAELRIQHSDLSLVELGQMLSKPLGKSGVNHRLRKLSIIADGLRESQKEENRYVN